MSAEVIQLFESGGGEFFTPPSVFVPKLKNIRAILFDWDGVFNEGFKAGMEGSNFSEVDAMGTNLLRYSLWKHHQKLPITGIITGEENPSAQALAKREHFHHMYFQAKNKPAVFAAFCNTYSLHPDEVLFFFDDVLDLEVARQCGARIMIGRRAAPMLTAFAKSHGMVDYITGCNGGSHGLREGCELLVGLLGLYDNVVTERMTYSADYQRYMGQRQEITTLVESGVS